MARSRLTVDVRSQPLLLLVICFTLWKSLLLFLFLMCPGPGYDTSTSLLYAQDGLTREKLLSCSNATAGDPTPILHTMARWDAIYFLSIARRGYLFEQEWAFGYGFTQLLNSLSQGDRLPPQR